ncbi:DNA/RNA non-specific endonuclease [uncultured Phenylobacterium sp.]|uniref:DNA/RNA non-specific endonuclease n=1 Tax=uncultured Phenylobacterium sp. TaxID=349273 RepID=UPI00345D21CE
MPATRSRGFTAEGQTRGVDYAVWPALLGTGTRANRRRNPPGWQGNGNRHNEARGHLNARNNGGPGTAANIATITQNPTNSSHMTRFDNRVTRRVRAGEPMQGSAIPYYSPGILPPTFILQTAWGPIGGPIANIVRNPAGRPR